MQIWCAVCAYKRSVELAKHNCEIITGENESVGNDAIAEQKKRSQTEIEITKMQAKICNMRYDVPILEKYFNCLY